MSKAYLSLLFWIILFSTSLTPRVSAQEMVLVVERCKALDQTSPINNIWVDEENIKWVSNTKGLHKVLAIDLVQNVSIPSGTTNLLTIRGGNANLTWNTGEMQHLLGNAVISSASYDPKTKSLWIGTQLEGAFQVNLSPLRIIQRFNVENKKLTSNQINDIFIQSNGTIWIATNDGMLTGSGDKWALQERYLNFVGVDAWGNNMWILGDDFLWQIDSKGKWLPIAIEIKNVEGQLRDIAVDDEGRVWIASNMMTGFDVEASRYQRFGPGQYFTSQYVNCLDVDQDGSIWTGTDDKGLYLIQWEAAMTINILMDSPLDCKITQPTAALSVKVTGGEPPYTYAWSSGQTTEKIASLAAGVYTLSVTDSKGLVKNAKYEIPDPNLDVSFEIIKPSTGIPQGDGSVNLLVNGGTGAFKYQWDNGEDKQLATKLTSGIHQVTITDDNGCSATQTITVPEKVIPLSVSMITLSENKCADGTDGVIEAKALGGKHPLTYKWSTGDAVEGKLSSLASGTYTVTVTDASGQTGAASITLTKPAAFLASAEMISHASVNMSNGQAQIKTVGGKGPYTYKWDNGETLNVSKALSPGIHVITVTDANGCLTTASINVSENIGALGVIVTQMGRINCNNQATASLKLGITGGKPPYTYIWSSGQSTETVENLAAGEYFVTVTDAIGTKFTASSKVTQPEPISINITQDAAASTNLSDGKATAKATGGSGTFQYAWDSGEKTNKALKLGAGVHTVTVTDEAGCSSTASVSVNENILELKVVIEQTGTVKCASSTEGSIQAKVTGGKEPYTFTWDNNGTTSSLANLGDGLYKLTITDAVGQSATSVITVNSPEPIVITAKTESAASTDQKDGKASATVTGGTGKYSYAWDNGEKTAKALALGAGVHTLTVTDENGCTMSAEVNVTENILPLNASITQTNNITCPGQSNASLASSISGGKPPYTIKWKGEEKEWTGESILNVPAGNYTIQVTDANGTSATSVFTINSPSPIVISAKTETAASTDQKDGKANATVTGGTGKYSYAWDNGEKTAKALALGAGAHTLTVTDENGCTMTAEVNVTENILPLNVSINQTNKITCAGQSNAGLSSAISGGKPPYSIKWKGDGKEWTGESILNIPAGHYAVQVTDANGSSATSPFEVTEPKPLTLEVTEILPASTGNADGQVTLKASGGSSGYSLEGATWPAGTNTYQIDRLKPGNHLLVVKDAAGCSAQIEVSIKENILPLTVTIRQIDKITCADAASASVETTVKGGKPPYTYTWNNNQSGASLSNLSDGTYTVDVSDVSGLKGQAEIKITAPPKLSVDLSNLRSATNDRIKDGRGSVSGKGGTGPYNYQWSSGETSSQANTLPLGPGKVTVTDANGCTVVQEFIIKEKVLPELTAERLSSGEPIRMEKIQFQADSVKVEPEAIPSLEELYNFLYDNPTVIIEVAGHTNGLPADDYCDRISGERAQSVAAYITNKGIEPRRVIAKGYGKRKPVATNQTPEGRKKNQRVEIRLIRIEE